MFDDVALVGCCDVAADGGADMVVVVGSVAGSDFDFVADVVGLTNVVVAVVLA